MDLHLKDKVILVTGGAKGIGAAIVTAAAAEGAVTAIVGRDPDASGKLQAELLRSGAKCYVHIAELTSVEQCEQAVAKVISECGKLDSLVNNAGVNDRIGLEHGSPSDFVDSLARNLNHYYAMAHFALPALKKSKGSILNISSKVAVTGQGGTSGYAAAKGGILALTREWAAELLPFGMRVNAIVPAEAMTPLYRRMLDAMPDPAGELAAIESKIPLGRRMTTSEEIAAMAIFLLSSRASHITGQHLFVDGGYTHLDRKLT